MEINYYYKYQKFKKKYVELKELINFIKKIDLIPLNQIGGSTPYQQTLKSLWNNVYNNINSIRSLSNKIIFEEVEKILKRNAVSIYYNELVKSYNRNYSKLSSNENAMFRLIENHHKFNYYSKLRPLPTEILKDLIKQDSIIIGKGLTKVSNPQNNSSEVIKIYNYFLQVFKQEKIKLSVQDAIFSASNKTVGKFPNICNRINILKKATTEEKYINVLSHIDGFCQGGSNDTIDLLSKIPPVPTNDILQERETQNLIQNLPDVPTKSLVLPSTRVAIPMEAGN